MVMWLVLGALSLAGFLALFFPGRFSPEKDRLLIISQLSFLVLLPVWGFLINWGLHVCEPCRADPSQALRTPDIIGLYVLYGACVTAFFVSRRQPRPLRPVAELWLTVFLATGILVCLPLMVQFGPGMVLGLIFGPKGLPLTAPLVVSATSPCRITR